MITVQLENEDGAWRTWSFEDVPVEQASVITIRTIGTEAKAQAWAEKLLDELVSQIKGLGGTARKTGATGSQGISAADFSGDQQGIAVTTLVFESSQGEPDFTDVRLDTLGLDRDRCVVLPILQRPDASKKVWQLVPEELAALNVDFVENWETEPDVIADHLLALAQVTTPDRRVFISYRRDETTGLANQLHTALVKADFDVFLDTVDVPPAAAFQATLLDELAHKAMVVILDSPGYSQSHWCEVELRFAEKHELGLLVLRTPEYESIKYSAPVKPVIHAAIVPVQFADNSVSAAEREMSTDDLDEIILQIKLEHQRAYVHRKRQLRSNILACCHSEGMPAEEKEGGIIEVQQTTGSNSVHVMASTPRRPELHEFQRCHAANPSGTNFVAFLAALRQHKKAPYDWVSGLAGIRLYDIVQVPEMVRQLKAGQ